MSLNQPHSPGGNENRCMIVAGFQFGSNWLGTIASGMVDQPSLESKTRGEVSRGAFNVHPNSWPVASCYVSSHRTTSQID